MRRFVALIVVSAALAVASSPRPVAAEWSADAFLGFGWTSSTNLDFTGNTGSRTLTLQDVTFDRGMVLGVRGDYWFASTEALGGFARYLGAGLELGYARHDIASQTVTTSQSGRAHLSSLGIDLFRLTPLTMARYPLLVSAEYPNGRLQPYAMLGPTIFIADAEDGGSFGPRNRTKSDSGFGVQLGPGLGWYVAPNVMVFSEYRFVHAAPTFDFTNGSVDLSINANQFVFGVSYRS